jgi:hypothetical protein
LSPGFSLAQVRPAEQERSLVKSLLGDAILLMLISCVVLGCASWVLGATVFANSYLPDWRGYVRREVLLVNSFALSAGLLISLRVGVAFGISASLLGGFFGSIAALAMGWFGRPGPVAGGVTAGVMLGACGALALLLPDRDQRPQTSEQFAWRAPAGLSVSLFLVAAIQMAAAELTSRLGDPAAGGRAAMATIVGGLLFSIFGGAAGWVAYGQQRGYFWRSAARFAFWVWCTFTLVTLIAAIFVPFGNPFTLADGVGVGLLSGAVFAGVLTVMTAFLKPVPAAASLLLIAWPLLHRFPNIEPDTVCRSLLVSSLVAFGVTLAAHRTTMPPAKPATAPQPSASAETRSQ